MNTKHKCELDCCSACGKLVKLINTLPQHKCGLHIEHNGHKDVYESVEMYTEIYKDEDWISLEEKQKAIDEDELWRLQWYPDTPIGFHILLASSFEAIIEHLRKNGH